MDNMAGDREYSILNLKITNLLFLVLEQMKTQTD